MFGTSGQQISLLCLPNLYILLDGTEALPPILFYLVGMRNINVSLLRTHFSEPVAPWLSIHSGQIPTASLLGKGEKWSFTVCLTFEDPEKAFRVALMSSNHEKRQTMSRRMWEN